MQSVRLSSKKGRSLGRCHREGGWLEVGLEKSKWVQLKLEVCRSYADKNGQARLDNV